MRYGLTVSTMAGAYAAFLYRSWIALLVAFAVTAGVCALLFQRGGPFRPNDDTRVDDPAS